MTTQDDLKTAIAENAAGPQSMSVDGQSATNHDLEKQIAAAKFLGANDAVKSPNRGIRFNKIRPGGAV